MNILSYQYHDDIDWWFGGTSGIFLFMIIGMIIFCENEIFCADPISFWNRTSSTYCFEKDQFLKNIKQLVLFINSSAVSYIYIYVYVTWTWSSLCLQMAQFLSVLGGCTQLTFIYGRWGEFTSSVFTIWCSIFISAAKNISAFNVDLFNFITALLQCSNFCFSLLPEHTWVYWRKSRTTNYAPSKWYLSFSYWVSYPSMLCFPDHQGMSANESFIRVSHYNKVVLTNIGIPIIKIQWSHHHFYKHCIKFSWFTGLKFYWSSRIFHWSSYFCISHGSNTGHFLMSMILSL